MTVVDSVAAVRLDEESGRLAGDHRVAHVREQLLRVAARDREADALVGDAPDARRRRARVEAELGLQPGRAINNDATTTMTTRELPPTAVTPAE
jgi:hypothetical protein